MEDTHAHSHAQDRGDEGIAGAAEGVPGGREGLTAGGGRETFSVGPARVVRRGGRGGESGTGLSGASHWKSRLGRRRCREEGEERERTVSQKSKERMKLHPQQGGPAGRRLLESSTCRSSSSSLCLENWA